MRRRESKIGGVSVTDRSSSQLMTVREVAAFLRVHVSSVMRWSRSGKLMAYKVGGRGDWRYREEDVLAFLCDTKKNGQSHGEVTGMLER